MEQDVKPDTVVFESADKKFEVTLLQVKDATQCILFAAGLGGNPKGHLPFLQSFTRRGISVVAPHFELLPSSFPTRDALMDRVERLDIAATTFCTCFDSVTGIGHSLGSVTLLMHTGAVACTSTREHAAFEGGDIFHRLVLLAPPADFFRAPFSLAAIKVPVQIWAGDKDEITPPSKVTFLHESLKNQCRSELHIDTNAGHFSFMNTLPPHIIDPHPSRDDFLSMLGDKIFQFIIQAKSDGL